MKSNRIIILLVFFLLVGAIAGALMFRSVGHPGSSLFTAPAPVTTPAAPGAAAAPQLPADSLFAELGSDVVLAVRVLPEEFSAFFAAARAWAEKLSASKLWNKLQLEQRMKDELAKAAESWAQLEPVGLPGAFAALPKSREAVFAISKKSIQISEGLDLPLSMLKLRLPSSEDASKIFEWASTEAAARASELGKEGIAVAREGDTLKITVTATGLKQPLAFAFGKREARLFFTAGAPDDAAFAEGPVKLIASPEWSAFGRDSADAAIFAYGSFTEFSKYFSRIINFAASMDAASAKDQEEIQSALDLYADVKAISTSLKLREGVLLRNCVWTKPGTRLNDAYKGYIKEQQEKAAMNKKGGFAKLIGDRTLGAIQISVPLMRLSLDMMLEQYAKLEALKPDAAAQDAEWKKTLESYRAIFDRFDFSEIGISFPLPPGAPWPLPALYLGGARLIGQELLDEARKALPEALALAGTAGAGLDIKMAALPDDPAVTAISAGGKELAYAGAVNEAIVIAHSREALAESISKTRAEKPWLTSLDSDRGYVRETLESGDFYFYIDTSLLWEMAKPYTPFLIMQAPDVTVEDMEELVSLLKARLFAGQRSYSNLTETICSDTHMRLLK